MPQLDTKITFVHEGDTPEQLDTKLKIVDPTDLGDLGFDPANTVSVFKIEVPDGDTVYNNTNFGSPDIDYDQSNEFEFSNLPEDVSGFAQYGMYKITQTMQATGVSSGNLSGLSTDPANGVVRVQGIYDVDTGAGIEVAVSGSGFNQYTIEGVTYEDGYTFIETSGTFSTPPQFPIVVVNFTYQTEVEQVFEFEYNAKFPNVDMEVHSNCDFGYLEVTDLTTTELPVVSQTRTGTIIPPGNVDVAIPTITFQTISHRTDVLYANGAYDIKLNRTFTLQGGKDFLFYGFDITIGDYLPVTCDDSLCCLVNCYINLRNRTKEAWECGDPSSMKLQHQLNLATSYIQSSLILRSCGLEGYRQTLTALKELLEKTGCDCGCDDEQNNGKAYQVTPITDIAGGSGSMTLESPNGSITVTAVSGGYQIQVSSSFADSLAGEDGSEIFYGATDPDPELGSDGDTSINTVSREVFKKVDGSWVSQFTIPAGADGADGSTISHGDTVPADSSGSNGDYFILFEQHMNHLYKKVADEWVLQEALYKTYRNWQDNDDQNPLQPAPGADGIVCFYLEHEDVFIYTASGNTYIISSVQKKAQDGTDAPFKSGEEVRIVNGGATDITLNHNDTSNIPEPAASHQPVQLVGGNDLIIPPAGSVTLKYNKQAPGAPAGAQETGLFVVAKNV